LTAFKEDRPVRQADEELAVPVESFPGTREAGQIVQTINGHL
jgi:hypothetical protein